MNIQADKHWVVAIAIHRALGGDETLLRKILQEQIELWNGDGI